MLAKGSTVSPEVFVVYLCYNTYNGSAAVSFQFSRIGNDLSGAQLLTDLDRDSELGEYIDTLPIEFDLERQLEDRWFVVCHDRLFSKPVDLKREPD